MSINRVTQSMLTERSLSGLQNGLARLAQTQEHISTGRVLNRPSDSPTETTSAMRLRSSLADARQHMRNASDGQGWLAQADTALQSMVGETRRARDLVLQGANAGAVSAAGREALAVEIEQLRESLISRANTTYLGRPVFGGVSAGDVAYDADGTYVGSTGAQVNRSVGEGLSVRVDTDAAAAFGVGSDSVFDHLAAAANALRAGDTDAVRAGIDALSGDMDRLTAALADVGGRTNRIDSALLRAQDGELTLTSSLSQVENVDLPRALVDLQMQEVAYQAALGATSRVIQPSLLDFLR